MKVFVSYSRRDKEFVDLLDRDLTALGLDVWVDRSDIVGSGEDRWRRSIVKAIRECDAMLLVLSPNSVGSDAVERELSVAADNNKRVVPVLLQDCELPIGFEYELAGVQRIDFSETTYPDALDRLSTQLRRIGSSGPSTAMLPSAMMPPPPPPPPPAPPTLFVERKPPLARRQTRIVLGATAVVVLAAVLVSLALSDRDGGRESVDTSAQTSPPEQARDTTAPSTAETATAPAAAPEQVSPTSTIAPPVETDAPTSSAPTLSDQERAEAVVMEWAEATSLRDWARVDRIDPIGLGRPYEEQYGSAEYPKRMESIHPYIFVAEERDAGIWTITGAVAAYDLRPDSEHPDGYRTNFVCSSWQVDLNSTPLPTSHWTGISNESIKYKVNPADFSTTYAETCG